MRRVAVGPAVVAFALGCGGAEPPPPRTSPPPPAAAAATTAAPAQSFADAAPEYAFPDGDRKKKLEAVFPSLDAIAEGELRSQHLPSVVLGVVVDGELAYGKGFGFADLEAKTKPDADTVYRIGSITKSFTALAVLALRDEGKLALDDALVRPLPEAAALLYPTRDTPPITLRQLLTHTSGLPRLGRFDYTRADGEPSEKEVLASLAGLSLENPPGARFVYSNLGFGLLGIAASRAAQAPYREIVAKKILGPLGMTSSQWDRAAVPAARLATGYAKRGASGAADKVTHWRLGASEGAGGLYSTLRDMARYVAFELAAYPPRDGPEAAPIRRSSVREAHGSALRRGFSVRARTEALAGEPAVSARSSGYGFGWSVLDTCDLDALVTHNGAIDGYAANVALMPERGVGVVAMTNLRSGDLDDLTEHVLLALQKGGGLSKRVTKVKMAPELTPAMARFLAVYNGWTDEGYKAMLSSRRPPVKLESEKREIAGYREFHGDCRSYTVAEVLKPHQVRLAMNCERGALEMHVQIDSQDGLITGFGGTSRNVPIPKRLREIADRLVGLIERWDEPAYKKYIEPKATKTRAETMAAFERLRSAHGSCKVKSWARRTESQEFTLSCQRGGDLELEYKLDEPGADPVATFGFSAPPSGACPKKQ